MHVICDSYNTNSAGQYDIPIRIVVQPAEPGWRPAVAIEVMLSKPRRRAWYHSATSEGLAEAIGFAGRWAAEVVAEELCAAS